jgi:hypothetical protein
MTNSGLEFDEGMGLVVLIGRASLTVCAEIKIVADRTLVAHAPDVGGIVLGVGAQGSIAANTHMHGLSKCIGMNVCERLIDRRKAVVSVDKGSVENAVGAVIPVWAVQALVADASDVLIAAVANSMVSLVAAGAHFDSNVIWHLSTCNSSSKGMLGVVTVGILGEASLAEIKVIASCAMEELRLGKFYFSLAYQVR